MKNFVRLAIFLEKTTKIVIFALSNSDSWLHMIIKGAGRVADRFKANFAKKHEQLEAMWDECPEADLANTLMRIDENVRFDKTFAKKAIHQITNGYKTILEALALSGCPKVNRYNRMVSWTRVSAKIYQNFFFVFF